MFKRHFLVLLLALCTVVAVPAAANAQNLSDGPPNMEVPRTTPSELAAKLDQVVVIDARSTYGWNVADTKIPGAVRVDNYDDFAQNHPKDTPIVVYCS